VIHTSILYLWQAFLIKAAEPCDICRNDKFSAF
jgi:hypothetical protein